jgi:dolichyl-phosphate-mannose--protein O-mannosyl transferase
MAAARASPPPPPPQPSVEVTRGEVNVIAVTAAVVIILCQIACFIYFAPITYGDVSLTTAEWTAHKWLSSWNFQFAK